MEAWWDGREYMCVCGGGDLKVLLAVGLGALSATPCLALSHFWRCVLLHEHVRIHNRFREHHRVGQWMDGWMDGCVDVWPCGCVDGWMDGCVDVWPCGCVDGWMDG
eukprot:353351-Chlamydomonas_euryale.AAC.2